MYHGSFTIIYHFTLVVLFHIGQTENEIRTVIVSISTNTSFNGDRDSKEVI